MSFLQANYQQNQQELVYTQIHRQQQQASGTDKYANARCVWSSNKIVAVVSRTANSYIGQAVIVIIIVTSVKCERWHKSSENNKELK